MCQSTKFGPLRTLTCNISEYKDFGSMISLLHVIRIQGKITLRNYLGALVNPHFQSKFPYYDTGVVLCAEHREPTFHILAPSKIHEGDHDTTDDDWLRQFLVTIDDYLQCAKRWEVQEHELLLPIW